MKVVSRGFLIKKRHLKSFDYLLSSERMKTAKMPSRIFGPSLKSERIEPRTAGQAWLTAALLVEASRQGVLCLIECVLRGWTYEIDESGRLWVYHPDVT